MRMDQLEMGGFQNQVRDEGGVSVAPSDEDTPPLGPDRDWVWIRQNVRIRMEQDMRSR